MNNNVISFKSGPGLRYAEVDVWECGAMAAYIKLPETAYITALRTSQALGMDVRDYLFDTMLYDIRGYSPEDSTAAKRMVEVYRLPR